jgi:hypothetical protein
MRARLSEDRAHVEMAGEFWSARFPVCALPAWLKFYREMAARKGGRYAPNYHPAIAALEAVARELKEAR